MLRGRSSPPRPAQSKTLGCQLAGEDEVGPEHHQDALAAGDGGNPHPQCPLHTPSGCSPSPLLGKSAQLTQPPWETLLLAKNSKNSEGGALEKTGPETRYLGQCSISIVAWEGSRHEAGCIFQREKPRHTGPRVKALIHPPNLQKCCLGKS